MKTENRISRRGLTLVEVLVVVGILVLLMAIMFSAGPKAWEAYRRMTCGRNLQQIHSALDQYHLANKRYPSGNLPCKYWTFQAQILEYLDEKDLHDRVDYKAQNCLIAHLADRKKGDEPVAARTLKAFTCPTSRRSGESWSSSNWNNLGSFATGNYFGVMGTTADANVNNGMLYSSHKGVERDDARDGLSKTLMLGERANVGQLEYGWWACGPGRRTSGKCNSGEGDNLLSTLYGLVPGPDKEDEGPAEEHRFHFWSDHSGRIAQFAFVDSHVSQLSYDIDYATFQALATRKGKETIKDEY